MVGAYTHVFGSWKVYPRANLCQEQFKNVYKRFKKISTKWQSSSAIISTDLTEELDEKTRKLENGVKIVVIGRKDVDVETLVVSSESLKGHYLKDASGSSAKGGSGSELKHEQYTVVICYEKIKDFKSKSLQEVQKSLMHYKSLEGTLEPSVLGSPLIVCEADSKLKLDGSKRELFCEKIKLAAQNILGKSLDDDDIIICGKKNNAVSRRVSDVFERDILEGIHDLKMQLQDFIGDKYFDTSEIDIIESDELVSAIQGFLKNGLGFVDILESNQKKLPFIEVVLINLVKVIRCAVIAPLANKNEITQDDCNEIAHHFDFDDKMIKSVSKNACYHLSKMEQPCLDMVIATKAGNKHHYFPGKQFIFIAYVVREDIKKVFKNFEEELNSTRCAAISLRKMLFELDGYLYSSKMTGFDLNPKQTEIPRPLKDAVLGLDGVYGIGTIYGRLVIHLEDLAKGKVTDLKEQISEITESYNFFQPYRVVRIQQKPKQFLGTGHGIGCVCPTDNFSFRGTLGGFAISDGELYALTCAHVVHAGHQAEHNIHNETRDVFGRSQPQMTIPPTDASIVDIAAVKVITDEFRKLCITNLKDEDGDTDKATRLYRGNAQELIDDNRRVFKHGAGSQLTHGIVCCSDYSKKNTHNEDHVVLIETLPGVDDSFAKEGDSGSVICMSCISPDHVSAIQAVAMLCSGNFLLKDGDKYYEAFLLHEGIQRLNNVANVNLQFPETALE